MSISKRIASLQPSATLRINEYSNHLAQQGKEIFRLGFGQSPFPVPTSIVEQLKIHAHCKEYLPVRGHFGLREIVANYYQRTQGIECTYENVLIGPGSKMYLFIALMAYEADLLLPAPGWVSYAPQALIANRETHWIDTTEENSWKLMAEDLEEFCQNHKKPKILLLNYPNNPTGTTYQPNELKALAKVARQHQIIVLSDEIYGELNHEGKHESIARYYPEGTIINSGLSKWAGAGGWRVGTILVPKELNKLRDVMATIASETFTTASAPIQHASVRAFEDTADLEDYRIQSRQVLKTIGNYCHGQLSAMKITTPAPEGGFYSFINFENYRSEFARKGILTSEALGNAILNETGVALLPGTDFGRKAHEFLFRMAYVDFDGTKALEYLQSNSINDDLVNACAPRVVKAMERLGNWLN